MIIPSSVVEIHATAFKDCASLREVVFTANSHLESIGIAAFYNSGITSFNAPSSLRKVCQVAFCGCKNLRRVILNDGLQVLGSDVASH